MLVLAQLWRFLCKFGISKLPPDKLYSFIQQAYFDSKKQPLIRNFFGIKPNTQKQNEAIASTSKKQPEEIIKNDIIEEPKLKLEFKRETPLKKRFSSPQQLVDKLPKNHDEILSLFDGNANKCVQKQEENQSFLERLDKFRKNSDGTIKQVNEHDEIMDVDIIPASPEAKNVKRKITDYFTQTNVKTS